MKLLGRKKIEVSKCLKRLMFWFKITWLVTLSAPSSTKITTKDYRYSWFEHFRIYAKDWVHMYSGERTSPVFLT